MNDFSKMNTGERLKYLRIIRDNNSSGHNLYFKLDGRPKDAEKNKDQNYPRQAIYRIEKNLADLPLDFATKYSKYFNVSFDFLYCNSDDINVGYDDVKKKLGLSDFALNKLEYMKNSEKEKKALSVLDNLLSSPNSNDFIELLLAIDSHRDIFSKNIVSQHRGNVFDQTIRKPIILENGDLEYISLFKVSKIAEKIASSYKSGGKKWM